MFLGAVIYPPPHILADPGPLVRRLALLLQRGLLQLALDDVAQLGHVVGHVLHLHQLHVVAPLVQLRREQLDLLTATGVSDGQNGKSVIGLLYASSRRMSTNQFIIKRS